MTRQWTRNSLVLTGPTNYRRSAITSRQWQQPHVHQHGSGAIRDLAGHDHQLVWHTPNLDS